MIDGKTERQSGTIVLLDEARKPALRWNFREGWPSKWEGPALNAKTNEVAIETLEIAHEGLELELRRRLTARCLSTSTPGVYLTAAGAEPQRDVRLVRTDVAGFVGYRGARPAAARRARATEAVARLAVGSRAGRVPAPLRRRSSPTAISPTPSGASSRTAARPATSCASPPRPPMPRDRRARERPRCSCRLPRPTRPSPRWHAIARLGRRCRQARDAVASRRRASRLNGTDAHCRSQRAASS